MGEGLYPVKFERAGVVVAGRGRVHTADILSRFLELEDSTSVLAPSNQVSTTPASPAQPQPKLAPAHTEHKSEAAPSDEIDVEAEIADMVAMLRTALSSNLQDVEGAVAIVNEIIKAARNTLGIGKGSPPRNKRRTRKC